MRCKYNCFECPYPDCISEQEPEGVVKKRGRKKLPQEVLKQHKREQSRRYYQEHKEEFSAYYKEYNRKNADRNRERQRAYRDAKRGYSPRQLTIWITNDIANKRVLLSDLPEYEEQGWRRGRS